MPNKEILRVEIDDSEFSEFKKKFDAYESAVKALPGEWQKSGTEITAHKTQFEEMASSIRGQAQELANLASAQEKIGAVLEGTGIALSGMAKSGVHFSQSIFHATASLRHWTKLTALFGGLIGAGGLFGIASMAASVARQRSSAAGLGVTYGELASFKTNFGRIPNAEGLLQGFSGAETNIGKKYALSQYLGHGGSGDPARDFAEGLLRFKDLVDRTPKEMLGPALQQRGYDKLGLTSETALAVKGMSRGEIEQISRGYGADLATRLGLSPEISKKWTEFTTKLEKAGEDIDTVLWKGLGKLTKPLEDLSLGFEHLVSALFRDGSPISGWIKDLGHGISAFAEDLGSGKTHAFADRLIRDIAATAKLFDSIVDKGPKIGLLLGLLGARKLAQWLGGPAVAIGEDLAGSALGAPAAAAAGAGAVALGMNKLMPQHPERLKRGQEYENAGGAPTSPHPAMTEHEKSAGAIGYLNQGGYGPFSQNAEFGRDLNIPGPTAGAPHFAEGGIVTRRTVAVVGEKGPEAIVPLSGVNLGNIRAKGGGWRKFDSPSEAAHAIIAQLSRYPKMFPKQHALDTLAGAIKKYAPRGDHNNPDEYARQVEQWTGINRHAHMALDDPEVAAKIAYGVARKEGHLGHRSLEDFRAMFVRHGAPLRRSFGHPHIGDHPATMGQMDKAIAVHDDTGGLVSVAAH